MPACIPHPNPLPEGEGTKTLPRKVPRGGRVRERVKCWRLVLSCWRCGRSLARAGPNVLANQECRSSDEDVRFRSIGFVSKPIVVLAQVFAKLRGHTPEGL